MRGSRAENTRRITELHAQGIPQIEIAARLGLSPKTVSGYLSDPDGSKDRARKLSYRGACEICGKPTTGSNGRAKAPKRCKDHPAPRPGKWPPERIIKAIQGWAVTYGEPPGMRDWNPYEATKFGHVEQARRYRRLQKAGLVPGFTEVVRVFGTWNNGIVAAGFEPRPKYGTAAGMEKRRRLRAERLEYDRKHGILLSDIRSRS